MSDDFDVSQILDDESNVTPQITIQTPSGASMSVMNQEEADYYNQVTSRYQVDNKFKNISDILELDRILTMELMCYRWSLWILAEKDYFGKRINPTEVQRAIETYSKEIRNIKKDLGIDKGTRDKDKGESTADYIQMLGIRAKEFGIVRNTQACEAITLLMELMSLITLYENSSKSERKEFEVNVLELFEWIKSKFADFERLDHALRAEQKMWIREI